MGCPGASRHDRDANPTEATVARAGDMIERGAPAAAVDGRAATGDGRARPRETSVLAPSVYLVGAALPEELWGRGPSPAQRARVASASATLDRRRLVQVAAVSVDIEQAAALACRSVDQVRAALDANDLVAVASPSGPLLPCWQLRHGPGGFVPGVAALARLFPGNPVALTLWVLRRSPDLGGRTPAQALVDGDVEQVIDVARTLTAAGW